MSELTDIQAEIWTNGVEWAATEIADLRRRLAVSETRRQQDMKMARDEIHYLHRRTVPIDFLIDRGNYREIVHLMHPLDQERVRDMVMRCETQAPS